MNQKVNDFIDELEEKVKALVEGDLRFLAVGSTDDLTQKDADRLVQLGGSCMKAAEGFAELGEWARRLSVRVERNLYEQHRCPEETSRFKPSADADFMEGDIADEPDYWRLDPRGVRICSYCKSLHPDDFVTLLQNDAVTVQPGVVEDTYDIHHPDQWVASFWMHHAGGRRDEIQALIHNKR